MTLAIHSNSFDSYCQTVQGSVLNIHLFFYQQNQNFKMKKDLKSLLSEENIQVLVADDMSVIKGGGRNRGGGHGSSKGRSGSKGRGSRGHGGGWGGCIPPRPRPRPRPCPPPPCR
jgi:hypothetical protein